MTVVILNIYLRLVFICQENPENRGFHCFLIISDFDDVLEKCQASVVDSPDVQNLS